MQLDPDLIQPLLMCRYCGCWDLWGFSVYKKKKKCRRDRERERERKHDPTIEACVADARLLLMIVMVSGYW